MGSVPEEAVQEVLFDAPHRNEFAGQDWWEAAGPGRINLVHNPMRTMRMQMLEVVDCDNDPLYIGLRARAERRNQKDEGVALVDGSS
jgi:hypothetical protein